MALMLGARSRGAVPSYRRWVFEVDAPRDEFTRRLRRKLVLKGVHVADANLFDFVAEAWGARGFVKLANDDQGIAAFVKLKAGVFGSTAALEDAILAAGREASAEYVA